VSDFLDFDALEAAGVANARERADLIKYLDDLGFTVDEMAEAELRGRLFGLAGDVLAWSGRPIYTLQTAAEELGIAAEDVARAWALLGLTVALGAIIAGVATAGISLGYFFQPAAALIVVGGTLGVTGTSTLAGVSAGNGNFSGTLLGIYSLPFRGLAQKTGGFKDR